MYTLYTNRFFFYLIKKIEDGEYYDSIFPITNLEHYV